MPNSSFGFCVAPHVLLIFLGEPCVGVKAQSFGSREAKVVLRKVRSYQRVFQQHCIVADISRPGGSMIADKRIHQNQESLTSSRGS